MQVLEVTRENGEVLQFSYTGSDYLELLKAVTDDDGDERIIGYYKRSCYIDALKWDLSGHCFGEDNWQYSLTPYDKFSDLKRAFSEGALIECSAGGERWIPSNSTPAWTANYYRIKGDITIEQWDKHKDVIKGWWNGEVVEAKVWNDGVVWVQIEKTEFNINREYRLQPKHKELTVEEIEEQLGYKIKIVGGEA